MTVFGFFKKRTARGDARWREKQMMDALEELINLGAPEEFDERLLKDFGISKKDPRYAKIRKIYEDEKRRS